MNELPEPLVAPDVDLRGMEWMPYYGDRLIRSDFNAKCDDAAWRAGHNLWWAAWNNVPAASLPNDDIALARYADMGRDIRGWRRVRDAALHGFVLCSDGRLYHPFLATLAGQAWDRRVAERARKARWRAGQNRHRDGDKTRDETVAERVRGEDRTGQDRRGQERKDSPTLSDESFGERGAPRRAEGSLSQDFLRISDDWLEEASVARADAGLPEVNLAAEAAKFLAGKTGPPERAAWFRWAMNARAEARKPNGRHDAGYDFPKYDRPTGPPPPIRGVE